LRLFIIGLTSIRGRRPDDGKLAFDSSIGQDWSDMKRSEPLAVLLGSEPDKDPERVVAAKCAIGDHELFVDANSAFSVKQALTFTDACTEADIRWFEEPHGGGYILYM
jgi:L-alanine-DL-glutamate epimerase-like enolase superfamily enzyme